MRTRIRTALLGMVPLLLAVSAVLSAWPLLAAGPEAQLYWPAWRGPRHTGVAIEASPPTRWSETENIRWKVKLPGSGSSTPIVWADQVFIQTAIPVGEPVKKPAEAAGPPAEPGPPGGGGRRRGGGGGFRGEPPTQAHQFVLMSLDRETGKTNWQQVCREELPHEGHHRDHGFSSSSPVTDGEHVIAYFGSRGVHCFTMQGKLVWEKDLGRMTTKNSFGEGSSPALHRDTLVINWDHEGEDFIVALNKNTGKELWRQAREEDTSWSTPLIVPRGAGMQVITAATRKVISYDLDSGEVLWEGDGLTANAIPSPVADKEKVYLTSGFRGSEMMAVRLDSKGDITGSESIVWSHDKNTPYVPSPLLYDDRLYFFSGNQAILSCFDTKSGTPVYGPSRIENLESVYASPVGAEGHVYLVGRSGAAVVIKHGDKLDVVATNRLDERIDASPAIVGDTILLRGQEHLYCVGK